MTRALAPRHWGCLLGVCALASFAGCGGKVSSSASTGGLAALEGGIKVDRSKCEDRGKQTVVADTNQDKKPDVIKLYVEGQQGGQKVQTLTCKQVDLNYDTKMDIVYHYDDKGQVAFEEFDLDFDGRFDLWAYYQAGKKVREEMDTNFDRRADFVKYYEADKLVRVERDTNNDGRVDEWQYYENGRLDRIGYDTTGSGRVDKWDRAPEDMMPAGLSAQADTAPPASPAPAPGPADATTPPAATAPPATQPPAPAPK